MRGTASPLPGASRLSLSHKGRGKITGTAMSEMKPLLLELGTEELPVKALPGLAQARFDGVIAALEKRGIAVEIRVTACAAFPSP